MKLLLSALATSLLLALPASASTSRILATQDWWPVFSPDGVHVAFTRVAPNSMSLDVVDLRTHAVHRIASNTGQLSPTWSSAGRLAFSLGGRLYTSDAGGAHRVRVTGGGSYAPAWRPGARTLAYLTTRGARNTDLWVGDELWARDVIGKPAWSPDGSRLAFRRDDGIYVTSGPGAETRLFGTSEPGDPVWSPEGSKLAFAARGDVWIAGPAATPAYTAARHRPDVTSIAWSGTERLAFSWRGGVDEVTLPGHAAHVTNAAGAGVAYTPEAILVYSGPRRSCPGHAGIVVGDRMLTGTCAVLGTPRADVIEGTSSWGDVILAGAGNDRVHANDGHTDRVDCGPGRDIVWADRSDTVSGCEVVHR